MSDETPKASAQNDPWARWRKPEAADQPVTDPVAAPVVPPTPPAEVSGAAVPPTDKAVGTTGTLSVRKPLKPQGKDKPRGRTGGKPYEKQGAQRGERSFGKEGQRTGDARAGKPAGDRRAAGKTGDWGSKPAFNRRDEQPWSAPAARPVARPLVATVAAGPAPEGVRLSKVMSERGMCSRREADLWIERGWVFVDGEPVSELGSRINPSAEITISKEAVRDQAKAVTFLLHKPVGYVSGQPEPDCVPAVTLITPETQVKQAGDPEFKPWMLRGLAPAGRLDVDSTGLLVLTSDGRVAKRLIGEDSQTEKEYLVRVSGQMIKGGLELLRHGLELDGKPLKPAWVKQLNEDQLHFILKEGKKRQIRRMCELVGLKVIGLKRVRIGRIRLGDLPLGQWRFLHEGEAF